MSNPTNTLYNDAAFRAQFPEFSDATLYLPSVLQSYWDMGRSFILVGGSSWNMLNGKQYSMALNALAAHLFTLGQRAASGMTPGLSQGGFQSGSNIDGISVQKLAPPVKSNFVWWLMQTPYGQLVAVAIEIAGVGGISIGGLPEREGFRKAGGVFL
jgi:hypothetical protein